MPACAPAPRGIRADAADARIVRELEDARRLAARSVRSGGGGAAGVRTPLTTGRARAPPRAGLTAVGFSGGGLVVLVGCDKTIPGGVMALARLNIPGLALYGGSIAPGSFNGKDVTIQDVFEAVGANASGTMTDADLCRLEDSACPGAGACGSQ